VHTLDKQYRINERIRVPEVRVIDETGQQLGIMSSRRALDIARDRGLDLIEVAPQARPPVCRIMDYGKWKYEQKKKEHEAHKKQTHRDLKTIKLHPDTGEHDLQTMIRHADDFLSKGHKVRLQCQFRGREMAHTELGRQRLERIAQAVAEIGQVESYPSMQGRQMSMTIAPRPEKPKPKSKQEAEPASV
jgi:translation initiation factor IF-3